MTLDVLPRRALLLGFPTLCKSTPADLERLQEPPLVTPTNLKQEATRGIAGAMNAILADVFALYQ